jgi:hypothetical protein
LNVFLLICKVPTGNNSRFTRLRNGFTGQAERLRCAIELHPPGHFSRRRLREPHGIVLDESCGQFDNGDITGEAAVVSPDVYGMPVGLLEAEEGAAYGAALLAGVGVGNWTSVENAVDASVRAQQRIEPDPRNAALMNRRHDAYRKLYPALRDVWRDGGE